MAEKMSEVYSAYDIQINQVMRGRGAFILRTDKGLFQLKALDGSPSRLEAEFEFKESLRAIGFDSIDYCVKNVDGELYTCDRYGNPYVLRRFFMGRECNPLNQQDIVMGVRNLAKLHQAGKEAFEKGEKDVHIRLTGDFKKRNQAIKRVNNYILKQKSKKEFEVKYLKTYDYFYEQGVSCQIQYEKLGAWGNVTSGASNVGAYMAAGGANNVGEYMTAGGASNVGGYMAAGGASNVGAYMAAGGANNVGEYMTAGGATVAGMESGEGAGGATHLGYCHGMYNHHSLVMTEELGTPVGTIAFDKFYLGNQMDDLYHYARKVVEKNDYSFSVLNTILEEYDKVNALTKEDYQYIYISYLYPEKFYKLANQYMNGSKNWLSPKLLEKLDRYIADEGKKQYLLDKMKKMYL
ncbi:MAG: hypothetical protein IJZ96_09345 [Lachnospiraceae bacterium]|nr:hypothetical protein [Lachnospiraceae bacterium]